ncbi:HIT-like domain-containing protein [Coniella lustricola]|uniref:HIT-like domain-containing protein n=1 Tax=Coniella lustricola TaxID=2025994 RepID=A0A2T3A182_9PEZI|nr:HIT-like domain-containing protein [Coniella lustricola]
MTRAGIKPPIHLPELVRATFNRAKSSGDVNFYPTQVVCLRAGAAGLMTIQLRFSPSLANKPKQPPASSSAGKDDKTPSQKPFNPFENPPQPLVITHLGADYTLVLNKFAIVPEHFLLITRAFKPQTNLLEAEDLAAAYSCIRAYHEEREELFAFFNCGEHSGASQPHRHLQLLPVARMKDGLDQDGALGGATVAAVAPTWDVLADRLVHRNDSSNNQNPVSLPFVTFGEPLRENMSPHDLRAVYLRLYRKACAAVGGGLAPTETELAKLESNNNKNGIPARISYNMAMTKDSMVLCPRKAEGAAITDKDGNEVGKLSLNGTVLAGTALVKSEAEWNALREDPEQLWRILGRIGVASG